MFKSRHIRYLWIAGAALSLLLRRSCVSNAAIATQEAAAPCTAPSIPIPQFAANERINVKDFGASGDGVTNDTAAINKAIEQCNRAGGGNVVFPAGRYLVASVHIKSNVCLLLDKDAVVSGAATGYDAPEPNPYDKLQDFGHSHFHDAVMWGEDIENFAVIGGSVDGGKITQGDKKGHGTGNKVYAIKNGRNLLFKGVTHNNGGHFVYLLDNCENVTIDHDVIRKSRDAIDLMGCRNVAVHDCNYTGCADDTLGIKSDWAQGRRILTENIYAWDDYFESGCNAVQFGSETASDFRNVYVWNIKVGLAMKAAMGITCNDGGTIENVRFDHFDIQGAANPIYLLITNRLRSGDPNRKIGTIRDVKISNITISNMKAGRQGPIHCATISGLPQSHLENITLENISMTLKGGEDPAEANVVPPYPKDYSPASLKARPASALYARHVNGLELRNVQVNFERRDEKPPLVLDDVNGLVLDRVTIPHPANVPLARMAHVTGVTLQDPTSIRAVDLQYTQPPATRPATQSPAPVGLNDPAKKDIAMQLVSAAENSSLDWKAQYGYIEYNVEGNASENRGYTGGIIGFTSKTHDMLELVDYYTTIAPGNALGGYLPALKRVDGTPSQAGLGDAFVRTWKLAAKDPKFREAQDHERDLTYFDPAVNQARADGLGTLGQFIYYDAIVMHGDGDDAESFGGIRKAAMKKARTPSQGGREIDYLNAFLDARKAAMLTEQGHSDTTRVDTMQRRFVQEGNLNLDLPLSFKVYGDSYTIKSADSK
jgi:chitosanase